MCGKKCAAGQAHYNPAENDDEKCADGNTYNTRAQRFQHTHTGQVKVKRTPVRLCVPKGGSSNRNRRKQAREREGGGACELLQTGTIDNAGRLCARARRARKTSEEITKGDTVYSPLYIYIYILACVRVFLCRSAMNAFTNVGTRASLCRLPGERGYAAVPLFLCLCLTARCSHITTQTTTAATIEAGRQGHARTHSLAHRHSHAHTLARPSLCRNGRCQTRRARPRDARSETKGERDSRKPHMQAYRICVIPCPTRACGA